MLQHAPIMEPAQEGPLIPEQAFLTDDSEAVLRFAADALKDGMAAALVTLVAIRWAPRWRYARTDCTAGLCPAAVWNPPSLTRRWRSWRQERTAQ